MSPREALPVVLRVGDSTAAIYPEAGGRLGQLDLGDGPLLRGPDAGLEWADWGAYPMLPWSNRIPGGHLVFGSVDARLPVNWPDGSAIHGLVASCPWDVVAVSDGAAELTTEAASGPYHVRAEQTFRLRPHQLRLGLTVVNIGAVAVPVGVGIHPWFRAGRVRVPAGEKWPGDPLPVGPPAPVEADEDLRDGRVPPRMDRCYTALTSNVVEVPGVRLGWEGPITQVVVYTFVPGWIAVEPVTMANDGFGLAERGVAGHGVQVLEPDRRLTVTFQFDRAT